MGRVYSSLPAAFFARVAIEKSNRGQRENFPGQKRNPHDPGPVQQLGEPVQTCVLADCHCVASIWALLSRIMTKISKVDCAHSCPLSLCSCGNGWPDVCREHAVSGCSLSSWACRELMPSFVDCPARRWLAPLPTPRLCWKAALTTSLKDRLSQSASPPVMRVRAGELIQHFRVLALASCAESWLNSTQPMTAGPGGEGKRSAVSSANVQVSNVRVTRTTGAPARSLACLHASDALRIALRSGGNRARWAHHNEHHHEPQRAVVADSRPWLVARSHH